MLQITVQPIVGCDILETCQDAARIATRLGVSVEFNFNGVTCWLSPTTRPETLADSYHRAVVLGHDHAMNETTF